MKQFQSSNHSSKFEITGKLSNLLTNKRIIVGMTGSVAVAEIVHLVRLLMRHGAEVFIAMTPAAIELIHPNLLHWATGNPVITHLTGEIEHVHLCGEHPDKADLLLIAPSTANTIGKIANGIDDTVVTTFATTALGTGIKVAIVPAMHGTMYNNPFVIENIEKLKAQGVTIIGPRIEEGKAKIATNKEILQTILSLFSKDDLKKSVVITAGPTRAWIDDIRFISNPSSGKMGIELALEAVNRGAKVTLLLGPSCIKVEDSRINVINIDTPEDVISAIKKLKEVDIFISAAAISDFSPEKQKGKISSRQGPITLKLTPTPKIIDFVKKNFPETKIVGFKAESGISEKELQERATQSLIEHQIDLVVGNLVNETAQGFSSETNKVIIIRKDQTIRKIPLETKRKIAKEIIDEIIKI